ncbi:hypothetical protein CBL_04085 [Carabus blaptoides fortunei]
MVSSLDITNDSARDIKTLCSSSPGCLKWQGGGHEWETRRWCFYPGTLAEFASFQLRTDTRDFITMANYY